MYDLGFVSTLLTIPACQSFPQIWAWTGWPICKGFSSFDCLSWYLLWHDCCFIQFYWNRLWWMVFCCYGESCLVQGTTDLRFLLINSCDGDARPLTRVFLYSSNAKLKSCPAISVLISISLAVCTVLSASPLDWGKFGDDVVWEISQLSMNFWNSVDVNWGPLLVMRVQNAF